MYYLQSRYYDPEVGRFLNADAYTSTGQGLLGNNMFAYCLNNPVMHSDPTGKFPWVVVGFMVVAAIVGGVLGATAEEPLESEEDSSSVNVPDSNTQENVPPDSGDQLSDGDRIKNIVIGASLGLAAGGAIMATVGAVGTMMVGIAAPIAFLGGTGPQVFALGAVGYDVVAMLVAPFIGAEMETIEIEP